MSTSNRPTFILELPIKNEANLESFVESCLKVNAALIAVVGKGSANIEEQIDWLIIGDGSNPDRFITTSAHQDETIDEVMNFCRLFNAEQDANVVKI